MDPDREEGEEPTEFDWFDASAAEEWRKEIRRNRAYLFICPFVAVLALAMPPAVGLVIGVLIRSAGFLRRVKKWDEGFEDGKRAATAVVTSKVFQISRPDGARLDLEMSDITGFTIDVKERPNLRIYLRDREPVDFKVYVAEAFSTGLWESLHRLDGFLPNTARREYIDGTEAPTADASRIASRKLLWYGVATLAFGGVAAAVSVTNRASTAILEGFMVLSMLLSIVGIALLICSALAYRRYCLQRRARLSVEVPGELIAYYEPDYSRVSSKRTLGLLALVFATAFTIVAFPDWPDFWMGLILGPVFLTVALYLFHLAAIEGRTVIVTDQYVGIVRGNKCFHMRHGQYQIIRGSLWLGFYLKVPDHGFILADASGAVGFTNRGNEHGFALNLIAKLSEEAFALAVALDAT